VCENIHDWIFSVLLLQISSLFSVLHMGIFVCPCNACMLVNMLVIRRSLVNTVLEYYVDCSIRISQLWYEIKMLKMD